VELYGFTTRIFEYMARFASRAMPMPFCFYSGVVNNFSQGPHLWGLCSKGPALWGGGSS